MKKYIFILLSLLVNNSYAQVIDLPSLGEGSGVGFSLQQLKDSALHNNLAIRTARLNVESAHQQRQEAFTKYFPNVSGTAAWFNANKGMARMDVNPSELIPSGLAPTLAQMLPAEALTALSSPISMSMIKNGTIAGINAIQPVFAGGQIVNGNRLAKVGEEVAYLQLRLSEQEVEKQTEQYYWQLISLQEKVKIIDAVDTLLADINKDVSVAVNAGVAMRNDLLQVQLRQNEVKSQRLKLQNGISIVRLLLAQFCGIHDTNVVVTPPLTPPLNGRGVPTESYRQKDEPSNWAQPLPSLQGEGPGVGFVTLQHPQSYLPQLAEYQLLQKQVDATRLQTKMAIGQNLPTLAVGAGYNYHNLLDNDRVFGMVFATVSVPISDWWGGSHAIKRKKIAIQQAEEQLTDNSKLLQIRMQNAWNSVIESQKQLQLAQQSIEQAEENLRLHRDYYRAGTTNMSDLLEAQLLYQQTLDKRTDAYAELQNKILEYRQSIGE